MIVFISYNGNDKDYAHTIAELLIAAGHEARIDWLDFNALDSLEQFMRQTEQADRFLLLVSKEYLRSINCMKELHYFMQAHQNEEQQGADRCLPVAMPNVSSGELSIYSADGQIAHLLYWQEQYEEKSKEYQRLIDRIQDTKTAQALLHIGQEISQYKDFVDSLSRFLNIVTHVKCPIRLEDAVAQRFRPILIALANNRALGIGNPLLERIITSIHIPSHDDPDKPEFPPERPCFPATPIRRITYSRFSNLWIKDESCNKFGSHKDRLAWEVIVFYKELLQQYRSFAPGEPIPHMSIISAGCAALSIQGYLSVYQLPSLKVLTDTRTPSDTISLLERAGCHVYRYDFSKGRLSADDVLRLTDNITGYDLTSAAVVDPNHRNYYDWLSREVLNEQPDYLFVPCGTGQLLANIINSASDIIANPELDRRFRADAVKLRNVIYYGVTEDDPDSKLDKLYSAFPMEIRLLEFYMNDAKRKGCCDRQSSIERHVDPRRIDEAVALAMQWNLNTEPSGMAGLAYFLQIQETIPSDKKVIIVNTGGIPEHYVTQTA